MKATPDLPVTPHVLLAEDDPISRAFLVAAVQAIPAQVDSADSIAAALALIGTRQYDLWLFDAHLPDGRGRELLEQANRAQPGIPALAHTASNEREVLDALIVSGFAEVLIKPLPAVDVQSAVRRALGLSATRAMAGVDDTGKQPLWDDVAAARALNGDRAHVDTLRRMFVAELPRTRERILASARDRDIDSMRSDLHKLRASCGFVGAARLRDTVQALQSQPDVPALLGRFDQVAQDTVARLAEAGDD